MFQNLTQNDVIRVCGLYDDPAPACTASGPAAYLLHQLKAAFKGPEVGEVHHIIGIEDTHHG